MFCRGYIQEDIQELNSSLLTLLVHCGPQSPMVQKGDLLQSNVVTILARPRQQGPHTACKAGILQTAVFNLYFHIMSLQIDSLTT